jgi:dipeptidyl-peptidase-4
MFGFSFPRSAVFAVALTAASAIAGAAAAASENLTLERIFAKKPLLPPVPTAVWVGDSRGVSLVRDVTPKQGGEARSAFVIREVPSGKERVLAYLDEVPVPEDLRSDGEEKFAIGDHAWTDDGTRAAFVFGGDVFVIDRKGKVERLTDTDGQEQNPTFSRDGNWLAYTRDNDLYTRDLARGVEIRHTATGCDTVYNGVLNWVYMEELFTRGDVRAFWWSPAGARLSFLEIRDGMVPEYPIVDNVNVPATWKLQRYPKPGDPNPEVRVGIADAASQAVSWTDVETGPDAYIVRVNWLGDGSALAIEKMNRAQDHLTLLFADAESGKSDIIFEESSPTWVNDTYAKYFYEKRRQFLWGSERDGHMHLYLYNLDGSSIRRLTNGDWEVADLAGADEKKKRVFFTANQSGVLEQHLYRVDEDGKNLTRVTTEEGTHDVVMSPNRTYFLDKYSSHVRPTRYSVFDANGKRLFDLADQASGEFASLRLPTPEFGTLEYDGLTFNYRLIRPMDFDPAKKYPVVVFTYGGPHAQVVKKAWTRQELYHAYLAQQGYVVFSLDNRGAWGRGKAWEEPLLKRMGKVELEDQVAGVEFLKTLSFVDADRIGVWGWSYGGYMTLEAMFNRGDVFKAGVAVAPVADWRLYDSIYTERYLKLPKDNAEGYEESAPLANVEGLKGPLLLMHGDADDNVHVQNSVALVRKLIDAGKDFDFMIYPQKEHGISGSVDRFFLYRKMTEFFDRHLMDARATSPAPPTPTP